ncbi:MAG TPA: hypothetical protein VG897_08300 [Terriglobales bacterium]|nr:hypothetical protein [Terriglobales bacterium]
MTIEDQHTHKPLKDFSQVAVWLVPEDSANRLERSEYQAPQYRMVQQDKKFTPHLLVVPIGSTVLFPNLDPWFHNVFSLYRGKRFDLGLYQAGSQKRVRFDRPGPSYIFCNIHPEMSAVIFAVNSRLIGVSDSSGNVAIQDVPSGRYRVHLWYEFVADQEELESREILVGQKDASFGKMNVIAKAHHDEKHTNKYGQEYDPESLSPEY